MFSKEQKKVWSVLHLKACHWYVEMNTKETPPHEEENLKLVEPSCVFVHLQLLKCQNRGHLEGQSRSQRNKKNKRIQRTRSPTVVSEKHLLLVGNPPNVGRQPMAALLRCRLRTCQRTLAMISLSPI